MDGTIIADAWGLRQGCEPLKPHSQTWGERPIARRGFGWVELHFDVDLYPGRGLLPQRGLEASLQKGVSRSLNHRRGQGLIFGLHPTHHAMFIDVERDDTPDGLDDLNPFGVGDEDRMDGDGALVHLVATPERRLLVGAVGRHGGRRAGGRDVIPGRLRHDVGLMLGGLIVCCVVCGLCSEGQPGVATPWG